MGTLRGLSGEAVMKCTAYLPNEKKPGHTTALSFNSLYKKLSETEFREVMDGVADDLYDDDYIIDNYFIEWSKLPGDGGYVEFSEENLAAVREHTDYRSAIIRGFVDLHRSTRSARQGN